MVDVEHLRGGGEQKGRTRDTSKSVGDTNRTAGEIAPPDDAALRAASAAAAAGGASDELRQQAQKDMENLPPTVRSQTGVVPASRPRVFDLRGLLSDIQRMSEELDPETFQDWIEDVALDLYAAGFYTGGLDELLTPNGEPSQVFYAAVADFFNYHTSQIEIGSKTAIVNGWREYLDLHAGQPDPDEIDGFLNGSGTGNRRLDVSLSSSAGLQQTLEATYRQIVGKAPTDDEKRAFVAAIHRAQKAQGQARFAALSNEGVMEFEQLDVGAEAVEFARGERPVEAASKDVAGAGQVLRGMI